MSTPPLKEKFIPLYSIGYATKPIDLFITQLKALNIDVMVDIRSVPFSKVFHDYHQGNLKLTLKRHSIAYVYLGEELGPRTKDLAHYNDAGQVQFKRLMTSTLFKAGLKRLFRGLDKGFSIALCCAEKDAATCHRSLLVGKALRSQYGIDLQHIDHKGTIEFQTQLERRLLALTNTPVDMITSEDEATEIAYQRQCEAYAYRRPGR
ncbi:DUF488 domain-containing protein [Aurantivibrio plasticivorans]